MDDGRLPQRQGLYDPANEHDACGVGFIVSIKGERTHDILASGLEILVNLSHWGKHSVKPIFIPQTCRQ